MAKKRIGKLPPRYSFILNPYADVRLSKCPRCQKLTYLRKFALLHPYRRVGADGARQTLSLLRGAS